MIPGEIRVPADAAPIKANPGLDTREEGAGPLKGVVGVMAARPIFTDVSAEAAMAAIPVEVDSAQISLLGDASREWVSQSYRVINPLKAKLTAIILSDVNVTARKIPRKSSTPKPKLLS